MTDPSVAIRQATVDDLDLLVPLFDAYRQFYRLASDTERAAAYGRSIGAVRLVLYTELTNTAAQSVYEKAGWKRDTVFCSYQLVL